MQRLSYARSSCHRRRNPRPKRHILTASIRPRIARSDAEEWWSSDDAEKWSTSQRSLAPIGTSTAPVQTMAAWSCMSISAAAARDRSPRIESIG